MTTDDRLRQFIVNEMEWKGGAEVLTRDYHLIENGVVDSLGLFMLVSFIENQFGILFELEELNPHNFATIGAMTKLIEEKQAANDEAVAQS